MRDLALAILGKNAQKQLERGVPCTSAQAHHIIHHDQCAEHLLPALVDYLERALAFAEGRLGGAKDDLRSIRIERMERRAESRRVGARRQAAEVAHPTLPGIDGRPRNASLKE